jgi:polysaccharide pyruvyl transferase WcaK-like protein
MKKIVISGWYGPGNIGDEAILDAIIDNLVIRFINVKVIALSFNPRNTRSTHKIESVRQVPSSVLGWIRSLIFFDIFRTLWAIKNCDLFIMGGGGFLSDWNNRKPENWLKQIKIAKLLKKETWLYGIGAGPFLTEKGRVTTKYYIDHYVDNIVVRDRYSYDQLINVVKIKNTNISIEIDPVANLNVKKYINEESNDNSSVALIFAEYFRKNNSSPENERKWQLLFSAFCCQIDVVLSNGLKPKLVFFHKDIEQDLANKFKDIYADKITITFPNTCSEAIHELNSALTIISFRLHGNILAYALKKPFLPIIYHHKTAGFLEFIDYPFKKYILHVGGDGNWKDEPIKLYEWQYKTDCFLQEIILLKKYKPIN